MAEQTPACKYECPTASSSVLQIHTGKMAQNSFLGADVDLWALAQRTKNFSGAEIEGLVKSATSFALNRQVDVNDLSKPIDEDNLKVQFLANCTHSFRCCFPASQILANTIVELRRCSSSPAAPIYLLYALLLNGPRNDHAAIVCILCLLHKGVSLP